MLDAMAAEWVVGSTVQPRATHPLAAFCYVLRRPPDTVCRSLPLPLSLSLLLLLPPECPDFGADYDERVLPSIVNEVTKAVVAKYNASELLTKREVGDPFLPKANRKLFAALWLLFCANRTNGGFLDVGCTVESDVQLSSLRARSNPEADLI